jgi:hypothetical protein
LFPRTTSQTSGPVRQFAMSWSDKRYVVTKTSNWIATSSA